MVRTSDVSLSSVLLVIDSPPEVVEADVREEAMGAMSKRSHLEQRFTALNYCTTL